MSEFFSTLQGRIALGIAALVVVLAAGGGYYYWSQSHSGSAQVASLSEKGVCKEMVARARDYGVLPPDAEKVGEKAVSDNDANQITCSAQADNATFKLIGSVPCDDANDDKCLMLQKVIGADGNALYDTHDI